MRKGREADIAGTGYRRWLWALLLAAGICFFRHRDLARGGTNRVDQSNLYMSGVYWNWVNE